MSNLLTKPTQLVLVFALMLSICFSSIAKAESSSDEGTLVSQTVTNEYDMYKKFNSKSDEQLINEGFSEEKIKELRSVDYKKEIKEKADKLAKVDVKLLKDLGYTQEQIKDIKNYTGTEEQLYSISATLALSTYYGTSSKSSTYSQVNFRTDWTWSSAPINLFTDALAVPWSEGMYLDTASSYTFGKYDLYDEWSEAYQQTQTVPVQADLNRGAYIKIDMGYHNNDIGGLYAKKGKFGYKIFKSALVNEVAVQPTYGHAAVGIPAISISFPAGLSVDFSIGTSTEAQNYKYQSL
ncbi:hypothetical protein SAMN04487895_12355 [Paenibacillus sophorae]|uniref:Uncharacterized protein n=1 Tax=Paenibacillus sophorae TaxID=1333845 RepID=A0A1H8VEC3_9BACL|nr:hypothetical protein [Paenibacillus sophorae]QWU16655.1 hypothetical protein KP014_05380 [Paenibacillus sophorae]SEP13802.1 hypothetical protein SAMN04487895_12355 [Paenibacillus sophorae]